LHDVPFFIAFRPFERVGYFYGYSGMEIMAGDQAELNAIHNQAIDNGTLRNSAVFIARRSMKWNPAANPIRPGLVLPADNPREDIVPLQFGSDDQSAYADEARVRQNMKETMGVNDAMLAQPTSDGTLGSLERALQSASVKAQVQESRVRDSLEAVVQQIAELTAQYAPDDLQVPMGEDASGMTRYQTVTRQQLQTSADFRVRGTSALANPVLQAQKAEKLALFAERSAIIQGDPNLQYEVQKRVLEGLGFEDWILILGSRDAFLQRMQEAAQKPTQPEIKYSAAYKPDEMVTLAMLIKDGQLTPEEYLAAVALASEAQNELMPIPVGAGVGDATDKAAGYSKASSSQVNAKGK
jgi:hypothetical protein